MAEGCVGRCVEGCVIKRDIRMLGAVLARDVLEAKL